MLDDLNVIKQRDPKKALESASKVCEQLDFAVQIENPEHDGRDITNIVIAGMGGSAQAGDMIKVLLDPELPMPLEIVKDYQLPKYVGHNSLVVISSNSGNTEETLACLDQSLEAGAQVAITATGGKLLEAARQKNILLASYPGTGLPRMSVMFNLRTILYILNIFGIIDRRLIDEVSATRSWMEEESDKWSKEMPLEKNYAKQLALTSVGKVACFIGGSKTKSLAYRWKISWNENAKNLAFCSSFPEFSHNEFIGWASHPVEKPFVIFDLRSNLETPSITKRFELTDRMLSGLRPKANVINLQGQTILQQLIWGSMLADFTSVYLGILNNVEPHQVDLVEKFKVELASLSDTA